MSQMLSYRSAGAFGRDEAFRWSRFTRSAALAFGCVVVAAAGMGLFALLVTPAFLQASALMGPAVFIVFAVSVVQIQRTLRHRRGAAILSYIEQAVRINLPLPRVLRAAAGSETGKTAHRLVAVCEILEAGAPLDIALETQVPELSARAVKLVGAGERLGCLPAVMRSLLAMQRKDRPRSFSAGAFSVTYSLIMLMFISCVICLYAILIMPKFQQIMSDFKVAPPALFRWMRTAANLGAFAILPVAGGALLLYAAGRVWELFLPKDSLLGRGAWVDWVIWYTPLARKMAQDRGLADVCRMLASALRAGFTLDRAISESSDLQINRGLRVQINEWLFAMRKGLPIAEAAKKARLPKLLVGMIGSAQATGGMADVFDFLAQYYETRFSRAVLLIQGAAAPACAIFFGVLVCAICLSIFQPLITLINSVGLQWRRF